MIRSMEESQIHTEVLTHIAHDITHHQKYEHLIPINNCSKYQKKRMTLLLILEVVGGTCKNDELRENY